MQDSKIIGLLKHLDAKEFRLLRKYFRSPFFNYSTAVLELYEYVRKFYPEFDHPDLDRREVYARLFSGTAYDDKKMRNLLHEFYRHLESFLVQLHLREEELLGRKLLNEVLLRRGEYELFVKKHDDLIGEVAGRSYRDIQTYQELLSLEEQFYFHPATDKLKDGADSLRMMLEYLDAFFITSKLRLVSELAARERIVSQEMGPRLMEAVLSEVERKGRDAEAIFSCYRLVYQLNHQGEPQQYFALKQMLFERFRELSLSDGQHVLIQLLNFAIRAGNRGEQSFLAESFELYWFGLENDLVFENGKLTDSTFTNIVFGGCKIGAFDQVSTFIDQYAAYLEDSVREDAEKLARAYLAYHQQEYEVVDRLIGNASFGHIFYQIRARGIQVRAFFELYKKDASFFEPLWYRIEAFEKYLRRNQTITDVQKEHHLNFLKYLKKISQVLDPGVSESTVEKLKKDLAENQKVINKNWLIDQLK